MTNAFEAGVARHEREQNKREQNKPDMVDVIADKLLADNMALITENKRFRDAILNGEREHISSIDCWCKPYQDDVCPDVWIHNELPIGNA